VRSSTISASFRPQSSQSYGNLSPGTKQVKPNSGLLGRRPCPVVFNVALSRAIRGSAEPIEFARARRRAINRIGTTFRRRRRVPRPTRPERTTTAIRITRSLFGGCARAHVFRVFSPFITPVEPSWDDLQRRVPSPGSAPRHAQAIGAITHRLCCLTWKLRHERIRFEERGAAVSVGAKKVRARKMTLRRGLAYAPSCSLLRQAVRPDQKDFRPGSHEKRADRLVYEDSVRPIPALRHAPSSLCFKALPFKRFLGGTIVASG